MRPRVETEMLSPSDSPRWTETDTFDTKHLVEPFIGPFYHSFIILLSLQIKCKESPVTECKKD